MSTNDAPYIKYSMYFSAKRMSTLYLPRLSLKPVCKTFNQNHRVDQSKYLNELVLTTAYPHRLCQEKM